MTFDELAHDIEARVREKLSEAAKNSFEVGPAQPTGDTTLRAFALGGRSSKIELDDGRVYLRNRGDEAGDDGAPSEAFAVESASMEPISEAIYEHLTART